MKNLKTTIAILAILLFSCSKNDDIPAPVKDNSNYRITQEVLFNGVTTTYTYNEKNKLVKIIFPSGTVQTGVYNEFGNLISTSDFGDTNSSLNNDKLITYNSNNLRAESIQTFADGKKNKLVYASIDGHIDTIKNYNWTTGAWVRGDNTIYFNSKNQVIQFQYYNRNITYLYDSNGNLLETKEFYKNTGNNIYFLRSKRTYAFDDKKNIKRYFIDEIYSQNKNNINSETSTNYLADGITIESSNTSANNYEFNEAGFPLKLSYDATLWATYTLEKY